MRVESDRQGHHGSEAPACHHCGVPLLEETTFCPYCERWLDGDVDHGDAQHTHQRVVHAIGRRLSTRALTTAGFVFFAVVAVACVIVALVI